MPPDEPTSPPPPAGLPASVAATPDPAAGMRRVRGLMLGATGSITRVSRRMVAAAGIAAVIGIAAQVLLADWAVAAAVNGVVAIVGIGAATLGFRDPALRAAHEVYIDHQALERAEWKLWTGSRIPVGARRQEQWLRDHPDASYGRSVILATLGRFDEAHAELDRRPPTTVAGEFERDLMREQLRLFRDGSSDVAGLHARLATLDERARRHRRECLATLESYLAVDAGRDPVPALAAGRDPHGPVTFRARWFLARLLLLVVAWYPAVLALPIRALLD